MSAADTGRRIRAERKSSGLTLAQVQADLREFGGIDASITQIRGVEAGIPQDAELTAALRTYFGIEAGA